MLVTVDSFCIVSGLAGRAEVPWQVEAIKTLSGIPDVFPDEWNGRMRVLVAKNLGGHGTRPQLWTALPDKWKGERKDLCAKHITGHGMTLQLKESVNR